MFSLGEREKERGGKFYFQRLDPLIAFKFNLSEIGNSALTKDMCFLVERYTLNKSFRGERIHEHNDDILRFPSLFFLIINFAFLLIIRGHQHESQGFIGIKLFPLAPILLMEKTNGRY